MKQIVAGNSKRSAEKRLKGVACEKPLARTVAECDVLISLAKEANLLTGYLENQLFAPSVATGKNIIWSRGAAATGRPYLARAAEEHSGPHKPWFWQGNIQGGGVLNDMMCHSIAASRFLLTKSLNLSEITPIHITATIASLKWTRPEYVDELKSMSNGAADYSKQPSEDYAHASITYKDAEGHTLVSEMTTSWSFVGVYCGRTKQIVWPNYA